MRETAFYAEMQGATHHHGGFFNLSAVITSICCAHQNSFMVKVHNSLMHNFIYVFPAAKKVCFTE